MRLVLTLALLSLLTACSAYQPLRLSGQAHQVPPTIGPYPHLSARLIVMEPNHRWQVLMSWQGNAQAGKARLTHAASGRVLLIRWHGKQTEMLDNQQQAVYWQPVTAEQLAARGMVIAPTYIAAILNNQIPSKFHYQGGNTWQGSAAWKGIRLTWQPQKHILTLRDLAHGREVRIILVQ